MKLDNTIKYKVFEIKTKETILISDFDTCINYLRKKDPFDLLDIRKHDDEKNTVAED